jgi:hypothetical protein
MLVESEAIRIDSKDRNIIHPFEVEDEVGLKPKPTKKKGKHSKLNDGDDDGDDDDDGDFNDEASLIRTDEDWREAVLEAIRLSDSPPNQEEILIMINGDGLNHWLCPPTLRTREVAGNVARAMAFMDGKKIVANDDNLNPAEKRWTIA